MDSLSMRDYIKNFSLDNGPHGNQGYSRVLLQLFGFTGHGKSSFINSCKYVVDDGAYQVYAKVARSEDKPETMIRNAYDLTSTITIVDNRGCVKMNKNETGEIYAQLGNFLPLGCEVKWHSQFKDMMNILLKADMEDRSADFIVPVLIYRKRADRQLNDRGDNEVRGSIMCAASQEEGPLVGSGAYQRIHGLLDSLAKPACRYYKTLLDVALEVPDLAKNRITPAEEGELKEILMKAWDITGLIPTVVITNKLSEHLADTQEKFRRMKVENIFPVENYTQEDHRKTRGKHEGLLQCLYAITKDVEFRMTETRDPNKDKMQRKRILYEFSHKRDMERLQEEKDRVKRQELERAQERLNQERARKEQLERELAQKKGCALQ